MDFNFYYLPKLFVSFLTFLGLILIVKILNYIFLNIKSYILFKQPYRNVLEHRFFVLQEENKALKQKIASLEEENSQIISSILAKINQ